MQILHQVGHNKNWNFDSYFKNRIGDGFILCPYNIPRDNFDKPKMCGYKLPEQILPISVIDLQYYGHKYSEGGKLKTYNFHPINGFGTQTAVKPPIEYILDGIRFQVELGLQKVVIPMIYFEKDKSKLFDLVKEVNSELSKFPKDRKYYMTLAFDNEDINNKEWLEEVLVQCTHMSINFDGYYVVCNPQVSVNKKISTNFEYYSNLIEVFQTLSQNNFEIIYGYANCDAIIFAACAPLTAISVGTYENLRNFNIQRFTETSRGGPSKGWYFSEKILNFIRADEIEGNMLRNKGCLEIIKNEDNIFSEEITSGHFGWNVHKAPIHKNYLLSITRLIQSISDAPQENKKDIALDMVVRAESVYAELENKGAYLPPESSNYHLNIWKSLLSN